MTIEFLPGLWVSKRSLTTNKNFIYSKSISVFINLIKDLNFLDKSYEYQDCIQKNIQRYEIIKMANYIDEITSFINKKLINNENILLFCENGIDKSQYIILAYLIKYGYLEKNIAMDIIKTKIINAFSEGTKYNESFKIFIKNNINQK